MAKQIIKLTESDLHRIIEKTVNKIIMAEEEDWRDSYDKWADNDYKTSEEGEEMNKKWSKKLKDEYPDKEKRKAAVNKHMTTRDVKKGKTSDSAYWRNYDKDMNESVKKAVRNSLKKLLK